MPRGDRTGPMGAGPMTGRRAGYCRGYNAPGFANQAASWQGAGYGFRGGGRGWRNMLYATGQPGWQRFGYPPAVPQDEVETLKAQANMLQEQLRLINQRIEELNQK